MYLITDNVSYRFMPTLSSNISDRWLWNRHAKLWRGLGAYDLDKSEIDRFFQSVYNRFGFKF